MESPRLDLFDARTALEKNAGHKSIESSIFVEAGQVRQYQLARVGGGALIELKLKASQSFGSLLLRDLVHE